MMTTGQRIKSARKAVGITQAELADRLGISYVGVSQWENNLRNPKLETLQRIADALDVPVGELLGATPQPDREYELVCDALDAADLCLEPVGIGDGSGPDGDRYYVWHKDAESLEEDREEYSFRELLATVERVGRDADARRRDYFRKRLDTELFFAPATVPRYQRSPAPEGTETPPEKPTEEPPEGE